MSKLKRVVLAVRDMVLDLLPVLILLLFFVVGVAGFGGLIWGIDALFVEPQNPEHYDTGACGIYAWARCY